MPHAVKEIFESDSPIEVIGTRHGEKLFESLVSREEMARVEETERYYRIPADDRDLNYQMYFTEGERQVSELADYTSHNTTRLDVPEIKELLLGLDYIRNKLSGEETSLD